MRRLLASALAALALLAVVPAHAQDSVEQEFSRLQADRAHRLGMQLYRTRNYATALREFEKAVALAPDVAAYRRSVILTRQRIAAVRANQKALRDSLDRSRQDLYGQDDDATPGQADEPGSGLTGIGPDTDRPAARVKPGTARGSDAGSPDLSSEAPLEGGPGLRDAVRDLHLGGSGSADDMPTDLPVAGLPSADLPVGQMPPESVAPEPSPAIDSLLATPDGQSSKKSMFPFLDPLTDSLPPTSLPKQSEPSLAPPDGSRVLPRDPASP